MIQFNPLDHPIALEMPNRVDAISAWIGHIPFGMFLVAELRPKMLVELGTHTGVSYSAFCQTVKQLGLDTRCYAVDTWEGDEQAGFYGNEILADLSAYNNRLYSGFSTLIRGTFDEALRYFPDGSVDLLHIDGRHGYEDVRHDFETWLPKLSSRAVVLFHDVNVRERDFGVWSFWLEIKRQYRHFEFFHAHGLGIIQIGNDSLPTMEHFFAATDDTANKIRNYFNALGFRLSMTVSMQTLSARLAGQEQSIRAYIAQVADQNETIHSLTFQLLTLRDDLHGIHRSKAWRLALLMRRLRMAVAPPDGRLSRLLRVLYRIPRLLRW